ncbi:MAG: hypothetical protein ACRELB_03490, partial [Polyangiaceae bacterium]
ILALAPREARAQTATATAGAVRYEMISLAVPGEMWSDTLGVSDDGTVLGESQAKDGADSRFFLWRAGAWTFLDRKVRDTSFRPTVIDAGGDIAGTIGEGAKRHPALLRGGDLKDLGGAFDGSVEVHGIGPGDAVIGNWVGALVPGREVSDNAFVLDGGRRVDLPAQRFRRSMAFAMNARGMIVGRVDPAPSIAHGALWTRDPTSGAWRLTDLGTRGGNTSAAFAIDDHGRIVGSADTENGDRQATLWQIIPASGEVRRTGLGMRGSKWSEACAISKDGGRIAGLLYDAGGVWRAVVWIVGADGRPGDPIALGGPADLVKGGSEASAINARGEVAGVVVDAHRREHAVLWRPV